MNQTPLTPTIEYLKQHAPFDRMSEVHLEYMAKRLRLAFFPQGEAITIPQQGPAKTFYIIKQGRVHAEAEHGREQSEWELVAGECFPIGALLARRPVQTVSYAVEDTFCFELDRDGFDQLLHKSPVFHDFCTRRLASLLDDALKHVQRGSASSIMEDASLNTALRELIKRPAITCLPDTPLQQVLKAMEQGHVGSMVVTDSDSHVLGIFTLRDLLKRVALSECRLDAPISTVMTHPPLTLPSDALAYEAALLMAHHGFGHICVVEHERLLGIISERDIFSLQRIGIATLGQAIAKAETIASLSVLGQDIHRLVEQMLAQGASVGQLTRLISVLNDNLTRRIITLCVRQSPVEPPPFVWLAFGSEGRNEQTLKTDQDNGILFQPVNGLTPDETRTLLLPLARRINEALADCGFPLCPGNIMAGNPECCLSVNEWRERFSRWIDQGTPEHLLKASIFFDFRPLFGDAELIEPLRQWLLGKTAHNSRFRRQLAENTLRIRPPLGLFGEFKLAHGGQDAHTLDLKVQGLTPFVDAARIYALAYKIDDTNTEARLLSAADQGVLAQEDVSAWSEAYHYIQLLRMRLHRDQSKENKPLSNRLDPDELNELDRRILKESFRQGRKLQSKIALAYQL